MKWINLLGFIISLISFLFWNQINEYFNAYNSIYSPDCGQYIVFYIGGIIGLYGVKETSCRLFIALFSYRLFDELTNDSGIVNLFDYFEVLCLFLIVGINYKNLICTNTKP